MTDITIEKLFDTSQTKKSSNKIIDKYNSYNNPLKEDNLEKDSLINTIKRETLDFDFEKKCSVTNFKLNIYCCLICGKYLQGINKSTIAYKHSIEKEHYLFICLETQTIYKLPEVEEINDPILDDIKYNLKPTYTTDDILKYDEQLEESYSLEGKRFLPGCIGINNIKNTDYLSVVFQSLVRIKKFRNFCLLFDEKCIKNKDKSKFELLVKVTELIKKMFNPKNFKDHVNPHEVMQSVVNVSNSMFKIVDRSDPIIFLSWILNYMSKAIKRLNNNLNIKEKNENEETDHIIKENLEGEVLVEVFTEVKNNKDKLQLTGLSNVVEIEGVSYLYTSTKKNF